MANQFCIPPEVLETLKCSQCKNYLSTFPIYMMDSDQSICGRCPVVQCDKLIRDEAYENIAQYIIFPCSYAKNGCEQKLNPLDLKGHEVNCEYRQFECPSKHYTKCKWEGSSKELEEHFKANHSDLLIVDSRFNLSFMNSHKENLLLVHESTLFVVTKEIDSKKRTLCCTVKNILLDDDDNNYNYRLVLESGNRNYTHKCSEKSTVSSNDENLTKITADFVLEQLGNPETMVARIDIVKSSSNSYFTSKKEEEVVSDINFDMLKELECPKCSDYMVSSIFQCSDGHSFCNDCKNEGECVLCSDKKEIKETRNYSLEKFATYFQFPCKYRKAGCFFLGKNNTIQQHQQFCKFGLYMCPVNGFEDCKWKDSLDAIVAHINKAHSNSMLKSDKINIPWHKDGMKEVLEYYFIIFSGNLFRVIYKYAADKMYWCVQYVGPAENCKNHKYEIDFIDNSDSNNRQFLRYNVVPMCDVNECFKVKGQYVTMYYDQLEEYITDTFSFRIRIFAQ